MTRRLSIVAATTALAVLPVLTACGGTSAPEATSSATSAPPVAASTSAAPPSSPTASATPTADPAQEKTAVVDASKKFASAFVTFGYPNSYDDYLKGLRSLTTDAGYAEAKKEAKSAGFDKITKEFLSGHLRSVPIIKGDVKIVDIAVDSAVTEVRFGAKFQQRTSGVWKTVKTSPTDTGTLDLVKQDGHWLVNHLPGS